MFLLRIVLQFASDSVSHIQRMVEASVAADPVLIVENVETTDSHAVEEATDANTSVRIKPQFQLVVLLAYFGARK